MPPKTKAETHKPILGQPDSVLCSEFTLVVQEGKASDDILPFSGPLKLPCIEQVLKLFYYFREQFGKTNGQVGQEEVIYKVIRHVVQYWDMAGFKVKTMNNMVGQFKKQLAKYQSINKNQKRCSQTEQKKREDYLNGIKKLFDIGTPGLEDLLIKNRLLGTDDDNARYRVEKGYTRKTEDISFLQDQRGERKMVMDLKDTTYEERLEKRKQKKLKKKKGGDESVKENEVATGDSDDVGDNESENDDQEDETDFTVKSRYQKKSQTVLIELPRDILNSPEVCSMLDRTGTTSRKAVGVVSSILRTGKIDGKQADLSQFSLSRPGLERKRVHNRSVLMEQEIEEFQVKMPARAALHWDGKLIKDVTGVLQENEAILVSGAPHYLEGKILNVSKLVNEEGNPTSSGLAQAAACLEQVKVWGVEKNIVALVFDTTSSNSGVHRGATVRLQTALGRLVFFLACRHHVSELKVKAVWYSIFEADLSPDCKFFADIRDEWASLNTSSEAVIMTLDKDVQGRQEALDFYRELLVRKNRRNEMTVRDDYRELADCAVILLGETPPSGKIFWRKPGACHKARFCAFGIYSLKALAFSQQMDLDDETVEALKRFCTFTTTIYIPHFLSSSIGCDAPVNDLCLFKKLYAFRAVDLQLAEEALVVLRRHCWYLTPEVVMFSLFSNKVSTDEKSRMASKLLTLKSSISTSYKLEKPKFPLIEEKTELVDLITPHSFKFFTILGLDSSWLEKNPEKWEEDDDFVVAKEFVKTVKVTNDLFFSHFIDIQFKVTNDVAERGVKMAADFATLLTKDDSNRSMLLQGVDRSRRNHPNFQKKSLNK